MSQDVKNILANRVRGLRESRKLSRENLSLTLGFDNSYISKVEKGKMNITIEKLSIIANFFEVEVYELLK